jgi:PilZ domain
MRLSRNPKMVMEDIQSEEQRRHGRLRCEQTRCCVGEVVDISASGMRVKRRGRPIMEVGDALKISIEAEEDGPALTLNARVVWIERCGFRQHVYGMEFGDLSDEQKRGLGGLARVASDQIVFRCSYN